MHRPFSVNLMPLLPQHTSKRQGGPLAAKPEHHTARVARFLFGSGFRHQHPLP
jgi:hypothetical protein